MCQPLLSTSDLGIASTRTGWHGSVYQKRAGASQMSFRNVIAKDHLILSNNTSIDETMRLSKYLVLLLKQEGYFIIKSKWDKSSFS